MKQILCNIKKEEEKKEEKKGNKCQEILELRR